MFFKLFARLFSKQMAEFLLKVNLETAIDDLDDKHKKYLLKLHQEGVFEEVLSILRTAVVKAGMVARTKEQVRDRDISYNTFKFLSNVIAVQQLPKQQNVNPLTNKVNDQASNN